jgi:hypothetical protein
MLTNVLNHTRHEEECSWVAYVINNFSAIVGTRMFITIYKLLYHRSIACARSVFALHLPYSFKNNLSMILPSCSSGDEF